MAGILAVAQLNTISVTSAPTTTDVETATTVELSMTVIDSLPLDTIIEVYETSPGLTVPELIEEISRDYGVDSRSALAIAKCESQLQHYRQDGEILRGRKNPEDIGVFQINEKYHLAKSQELGFDIYTPAGNVEYALWLLSNYGRAPWRWSQPCWG